MRNGTEPWLDEIIPWIRNGRKCLDIYYDFSAPNEFFDVDYVELGYETPMEFEEDVWMRLLVRYFPDDKSFDTRQSWDTPNYTDSFDFELDDDEMDEIRESLKILEEQGDLDESKYDWDELM